MAQHFQFISKFNGKVASSSLNLDDENDRMLVMEMAVKCGDLGNPAKSFDQAKKWTNLVMEEFFRQVCYFFPINLLGRSRKANGISRLKVYGSIGY